MRRGKRLLGGRVAGMVGSGATSDNSPSARGFLTVGGTTYVDPHGSYPLTHRLDGSATLIVNDTDQYVTVVTERGRDRRRGRGRDHRDPPLSAAQDAPAWGEAAAAGQAPASAPASGQASALGHGPASGHIPVRGHALGRDLVLAPGERAETWRGDSVRVG
ncbi:hypothetical protein Sgleb_49580 [Streptomyces glebosus]|uniref:Uncharacterized protein n=1 Tax=Streptomyces glebosus TaxID=249580 RepID=A0A640T342_9ACTN|nr:hypothetical protein Sgleb_49580 [Streptomyces glebosus]GHG52441.1 hypothetical protein GCM10010513_12520 [Streptomyces glebosus]